MVEIARVANRRNDEKRIFCDRRRQPAAIDFWVLRKVNNSQLSK